MTKIKIKGTARTTLTYDDGRVETFEDHNMIVTSGFDFLISSLINSQNRPDALGYIALGTGTTAANASQTALVSQYSTRKQGTWSWTAGSKVFTITANWSKGAIPAGTTITEGGVFNASTGGTMFDRIVFSTPFAGSSDVQFTQQFEFEVA